MKQATGSAPVTARRSLAKQGKSKGKSEAAAIRLRIKEKIIGATGSAANINSWLYP